MREGGRTQVLEPLQQLKTTHGERIIDASADITKVDLVRYYAPIADRMPPRLKNSPVALVRAPSRIEALFLQKYAARTSVPGLTMHDCKLWSKHPLLSVDTVDALLSAAQMDFPVPRTPRLEYEPVKRSRRLSSDISGKPFQSVFRRLKTPQTG